MTSLTHNIVISFSTASARAYTAFASDFFASVAENYLLSGKALPHISLCQLSLPDAFPVPDLLTALEACGNPKISLIPSGFSYRIGTGLHNGLLWAELVFERTSSLQTLHENIVQAVSSFGLSPQNAFGPAYHPHLTFCNLRADRTRPSVSLPAGYLQPWQGKVRLSFGPSGPNGQLLDVFWQKPLLMPLRNQ